MEINRKEINRYLGYQHIVPDENINLLIDECIIDVQKASEPKTTFQRFPLKIDGDLIKIESLEFKSANLSKNLKDCDEVILFAATLGMDVDRTLARYSKINVSKALIFQSTAAAAIEGVCNELNEDLRLKIAEEGLFLRPRFSPGYGDVPLAIQKDFLSLINAKVTTGIILTEGDLMIPEKSVTAFIGISKNNTNCQSQGCEACAKKDCSYRR